MKNIEHIRHSLAHLLGAAVFELYPGSKLAIGPAIEDGFYYDIDLSSKISDADLPAIEDKMREILKAWKGFTKLEIDKEVLQKIYAGNPYKLELIEEITKKGEPLTVYYSGPDDGIPSSSSLATGHYPLTTGFLDLCRGGHVENIKDIEPKAFKLSHLAGVYWRCS